MFGPWDFFFFFFKFTAQHIEALHEEEVCFHMLFSQPLFEEELHKG